MLPSALTRSQLINYLKRSLMELHRFTSINSPRNSTHPWQMPISKGLLGALTEIGYTCTITIAVELAATKQGLKLLRRFGFPFWYSKFNFVELTRCVKFGVSATSTVNSRPLRRARAKSVVCTAGELII